MSFEYPNDLKYLDSHEYVRLEGDIATVGITAFAIDQLGDIVFLELPDVGATVSKAESFGTVESVKAVEDLKAPISGIVLDRNDAMVEAPEQLVTDPYGNGWLIKVRIEDAGELADTLSADAYQSMVEGSH
jgi:glycine cleavage system H protein